MREVQRGFIDTGAVRRRVAWRRALAPARGGLIAAVLACAACATGTPVQRQAAGPAPADAALYSAAAIPRIQHASLHRHRLSLTYRVNATELRVTASVGPLDNASLPDLASRLPVRVLTPATAAGPEADAVPLSVRDNAQWQALLNAALGRLTPATPGHGACVDILKQEELFLSRNGDGALVSVPMLYKPAGIKVQDCYAFGDLLDVMLRELSDSRRHAGPLLYETGDERQYGYPFVYVDAGAGVILFLQGQPPEDVPVDATRAGGTLQLFLRMITDHVRGAINLPVSSVVRLFTLVGGTTADMVQPTSLGMLAAQSIPPLGRAEGMDLPAWEAMLDELTGTASSAGRLRYHVGGAAFFPQLIDRIAAARHSVWLRVYIFDNDDYAIGIADLLRRRSRDIDVRVLVDGLGTLGAGMAASPSLPPDHVPEPSITRYLEQGSRVRVRTVANVWLAGDHTKTILIDGETAFLGGMNIGREYRYDWHDMMVEVSGPVVGEIEASFRRAWADAGWFGDLRRFFARERPAASAVSDADYPVRLLFTRPADAQILRAQIAATRQARHHIYLENPYLTSDEMIYELVKARRRGVDVRVILPYRTDSGLITRSNALAANTMLQHGIRVYIYPGMSHLKAAVYDGWACLGSANLDRLSLRTNREMNLATSHAPAVDALVQQVFEVDMDKALELEEPLPSNWSDYLAELLADYL